MRTAHRADGFAKNDRANINDNELKALQRLAAELLGYSDSAIEQSLQATELIEVHGNGNRDT